MNVASGGLGQIVRPGVASEDLTVPPRGEHGAGAPELDTGTAETLQAATRVLAGVALRSLDVLDGAVTLPQFRLLAVLAVLGRSPSGQAARALGLDASTVTRLADRLVAAGFIHRSNDLRHRSVVLIELTVSGQELVAAAATWRRQEMARILGQIEPQERARVTGALRMLVEAAGEGYGVDLATPLPLLEGL
jgi:DNA-binding MarR family transcriptional regulator